jgi:CheY-like chemotaxis protein
MCRDRHANREDAFPMFRVLVTTTDEPLRRHVASAFEELACEVLTADGGVDCLCRVRSAAPDLIVLLPPLLWGSVAGVLAVLHDDPATRRVPVLVLDPSHDEEPPRRTAQLLLADAPEGEKVLPPLVERACARLRRIELAHPADPPAP